MSLFTEILFCGLQTTWFALSATSPTSTPNSRSDTRSARHFSYFCNRVFLSSSPTFPHLLFPDFSTCLSVDFPYLPDFSDIPDFSTFPERSNFPDSSDFSTLEVMCFTFMICCSYSTHPRAYTRSTSRDRQPWTDADYELHSTSGVGLFPGG